MSWLYRLIAGLLIYVMIDAKAEATPKALIILGGLLLLGEIAAWREAWVEKSERR